MVYKKNQVFGRTIISSTVTIEAFEQLQSSGNISSAIRDAFDAWVAAGAPIVAAPYKRTLVNIGTYFTEDDYHTVRAYSIARKYSLARTIRMAVYWYLYHRG